jgi:uncharacterized protein YbgA (DUF1722 family)/uncharacterized protein YbbK (DUF523 family)
MAELPVKTRATARPGRAAERGAGEAIGARPLWLDDAPIRVGVSTCLLGESVRWDGGHKRDRYLTDVLAPYFEWVPVCPEVEVGMTIPRPPVRLVREGAEARLVEPKSGADWTPSMRRWAAQRLRGLAALELCGYVLKQGSPSCGMERVKLYGPEGAERKGTGLFAAELLRRFASLPVEEEGRLHDARLREAWIERVFAYRRLRSLLAGRPSRGRLVAFHTVHKLQLLAHSETHYRSLGRLVAGAKGVPEATLRERYESGFMAALARPATPRRHVNVLQHALGHLRGRAEPAVTRELHQLVDDYGRGLVPLVVPLTMLRHYVKRLEIPYLADQVYLDPHPKELMLRNHV